MLDHDHFTGQYLGAAHSFCNLQRRKTLKIPVFFHNFRGYDSHFIAQAFGEFKDVEIKVIAQSMEKYMQVEWGKHIVFRDSLQFLNASLDSLVKSLNETATFPYFYQQMQFYLRVPSLRRSNGDDGKDQTPAAEGRLPVRVRGLAEKLELDHLPTREEFYDRLNERECSVESYQHAQKVWQAYGCATLRDYMELYLMSDVLLLADVFENFRHISMKAYRLDPAHYISSPQLAWDALLLYCNIHIPLQTDTEIYRMVKPAIRGGICHAAVRYARANNVYMGSLYDPEQPSTYIFNFDANNLYGWAQSQPLPVGLMTWMTEGRLREVEASLKSGDYGREDMETKTYFILEVDLEYPPGTHCPLLWQCRIRCYGRAPRAPLLWAHPLALRCYGRHSRRCYGRSATLLLAANYCPLFIEIHDRDDDYPMAPETMWIDAHMRSDHQVELQTQFYPGTNEDTLQSRKLLCTLLDKKHYVCFSENLQFYINSGMRLTKVRHCVT